MALFLAALVLGLLIGWLRGGSLGAVGAARVRWVWLAPLAFAGQLVLAYGVGLDVPWWVAPLHLGSIALLLAVVVANWPLAWLRVVGLGLLLNGAAIATNGGLMPQAPETLHVKHSGETISAGQHPPLTKDIVVPRDEMRLPWLGDVIATPPGLPVQNVVSLGDIVVALGLAGTVQGLMQPRRWRATGRRGALHYSMA